MSLQHSAAGMVYKLDDETMNQDRFHKSGGE